MPAKTPEICPHCQSKSLYEANANARGGYGPDLLPGLGEIFHSATFRVVVCSECGATQFFADEKSRAKLAESSKWKPL
jgi:predicted nucleic-acid-binding Zn-ribbon protein